MTPARPSSPTRGMAQLDLRALGRRRGSATRTAAALAATLLVLAASVPSADAQPPAAPREIRAHFSCSGDKTIDATFVVGNPASVRLALSDGRTLSLPQALSASGARYANGDESVVFWNKGNTAFIEEGGKTTYAGCATSR